jgi:hypothetical protein
MPKTYRVFMTAFGQPGEIREVEVESNHKNTPTDVILNDIFYFGQNDIQPKEHPSVSMGDIIELKERDETFYYLVMATGFHQMTPTELIEFLHTERTMRSFHPLVRGR